MTEQEAIKVIKCLNFCGLCTTGPCGDCERKLAKDAVLLALEEIQQYRAIGTVEECREAREKQRPKSPDVWGDGYSDGEMVYDMYDCPGCGESYEIDGGKYDFCPKCGQALNWRT